MTYEEMRNYHMSVTEKEVFAGIINVDNAKACSLAFLRKINNLSLADKSSRGGPISTPKL